MDTSKKDVSRIPLLAPKILKKAGIDGMENNMFVTTPGVFRYQDKNMATFCALQNDLF